MSALELAGAVVAFACTALLVKQILLLQEVHIIYNLCVLYAASIYFEVLNAYIGRYKGDALLF